MIRPPGHVFVSEKEAEFRMKVRDEKQYQRLVTRLVLSKPVQSVWNLTPPNPIQALLNDRQTYDELRVGLSDYLLEAFIGRWPGRLRLLSNDGRLHEVVPDILFSHLDSPTPDLLNMPLGSLAIALRYRAQNRKKWFAFLSAEWKVLPVDNFRHPSNPDENALFEFARTHLERFAGSKLCVLTNERLAAALAHVERQNGKPITREELAARMSMNPNNTSFRTLWKRLTELGIPVAVRGKNR